MNALAKAAVVLLLGFMLAPSVFGILVTITRLSSSTHQTEEAHLGPPRTTVEQRAQ